MLFKIPKGDDPVDNKKSANQIESALEDIFKKVPALPPNAIDTVVRIIPWLALIFGILGILGAFFRGFGILSVLAPSAVLAGTYPYGRLGIITIIGGLVASIMMLIAFPGLKAGKMGGWTLLFWSEVVNAVTSIIGFSIGSVIGTAIAFYLLFQIKTKYK